MPRRLAVLDLGTNSARLLVADVSRDGAWRAVVENRIACRFGQDLASTGNVAPETEERTARALVQLAQQARSLGDVTLRVVATHALRAAHNGALVQERLEARLGQPIQCLSGEREAQLVLLAAQQLVQPTEDEPLVALDLGGGSLEFAVQEGPSQRPRLLSLPLGAVVLSHAAPSQNLPAAAPHALQDQVRRVLVQEAASVRGIANRVVVSGGTAVCAAALLGFASPWNGARFAAEALPALRAMLAALDLTERKALPAVGDRADIIVAGMIVLQEAVQHLGASDCVVLEHGVREGALLALAQGAL